MNGYSSREFRPDNLNGEFNLENSSSIEGHLLDLEEMLIGLRDTLEGDISLTENERKTLKNWIELCSTEIKTTREKISEFFSHLSPFLEKENKDIRNKVIRLNMLAYISILIDLFKELINISETLPTLPAENEIMKEINRLLSKIDSLKGEFLRLKERYLEEGTS